MWSHLRESESGATIIELNSGENCVTASLIAICIHINQRLFLANMYNFSPHILSFALTKDYDTRHTYAPIENNKTKNRKK